MGVGFLHGVLPQGLTKSFFTSPQKIQVVTTDEIFFPVEVRKQLEDELRVKFSVTVTRNWDELLAKMVETPSTDLIFLPSFWAKTLAQQNLLADISGQRKELRQRVSTDFLSQSQNELFYFLPFFWMKTYVTTPDNQNFTDFLKNKSAPHLYLIADEDLLLQHFEKWKQQGLWEQVAQKKILTLPLDQLNLHKNTHDSAAELPTLNDHNLDLLAHPGALLVWGAAIPANSHNKALVLELLDTLTTPEHQEALLQKTPFNSTFSTVTADEIPLQRRADFIRNLQLKDTLILEDKDINAKTRLKEEFGLTL